MATTKLTKTYGSSGNRKTYTLSVWVKFSSSSSTDTLVNVGPFSGDNEFRLSRNSDGKLEFHDYGSSAYKFRYKTNRLLRDTNAWYHIVCAVDTTQGTSGDRIKIYINGSQETSFTTSSAPSQNLDTDWGLAQNYTLAATESGNYIDGILSHFHYTDGTAYDASAFGSTDATTGEWKINTSPSVTYGTNGFFILKDGNSVTDQSGNSNNWTVGAGTLTKTEDCPSNVFATLNSLDTVSTLSNGNTKVVGNTSGYFCGATNVGAKTGKYYCEVKFAAESSSNQGNIAIQSTSNVRECSRRNYHSNQVGASYPNVLIEMDGSVYTDSGSALSGNWGAFAVGDIVMIAMDLDNSKVYFGKNGTWGNSGDPTSGSTGTGAAPISANTEEWFFGCGDRGTSTTATYEWNFGNGYFGTTAVSSAGTNASGNGIFEYDVPTGYTALSTKGLNE